RAARTTNGTYKVNQQSLSSIMVPVPRREDQEQIAALDAERTKLDSQLAQGLVSLNELFASLQHRAFRGEL
ncbi:MAG TPA: restriction endonuclease, partial [Microbacterium sp.]|nr:restriction endonuclease [Microbacterium sp.]